MTQPAIDPCPECAAAVKFVSSAERNAVANYRAYPCRHLVAVTAWPDRIQLDRP